MEKIEVFTQEEFDRLPKKFEIFTVIQIKSNILIKIVDLPENCRAELWGSSSAELWESSSAVLRESSSAVLRESSSAVLRESSRAVLRESSSAVLRESSSAELRESSSAVLRGSSRAVLRESSSAELWGNSIVQIFSALKIEIHQYSVAICIGSDPEITEQDRTSQCIKVPVCLDDINSYERIHRNLIQTDGRIMLIKMTQEDNTDHHTGKIKYEGITRCPDWDPNPDLQCGRGLHLSATESEARSYHDGKMVRCLVNPEDIAVYGPDISKVRCREVCAEVQCRDCGVKFFPNQTFAETKGVWICSECQQGENINETTAS